MGFLFSFRQGRTVVTTILRFQSQFIFLGGFLWLFCGGEQVINIYIHTFLFYLRFDKLYDPTMHLSLNQMRMTILRERKILLLIGYTAFATIT